MVVNCSANDLHLSSLSTFDSAWYKLLSQEPREKSKDWKYIYIFSSFPRELPEIPAISCWATKSDYSEWMPFLEIRNLLTDSQISYNKNLYYYDKFSVRGRMFYVFLFYYLSLHFFSFCGAADQTCSILYARQVFAHWTSSPALDFFWALHNSSWPWICYVVQAWLKFVISFLCLRSAGISGMCHHNLTWFKIVFKNLLYS
jgi:hypothetical protein